MREKTGNGHNVELDQFLEDIRMVVRDGQELLKAGMATMKDKTRQGVESTGEYVQTRPYQSMGLAFGVGILVGLLASGMLSRKRESQED